MVSESFFGESLPRLIGTFLLAGALVATLLIGGLLLVKIHFTSTEPEERAQREEETEEKKRAA